MVSEPGRTEQRGYDRWFPLGDKRNELLALWEVRQYGRDSFGDPDYVSLYGLKPHQWYARGVRVLGRTAVECTRDQLAALIGRDIAAVAQTAPAVGPPVVVDLFAGSGNTLYWIKRQVGARRAIGFELDDAVFELARTNLSLMGLGIDLKHGSYQHGLQALGRPGADLLIIFVAPPGAMPSATDQGSALAAPSHRRARSSTSPLTFSATRGCCLRAGHDDHAGTPWSRARSSLTILPRVFFGSASRNSTTRGYL